MSNGAGQPNGSRVGFRGVQPGESIQWVGSHFNGSLAGRVINGPGVKGRAGPDNYKN